MVGNMAEVVLRELEPSVERLLEWHLAAARDWLPHQFVPWSAARDFDGPLKGLAWESAQSKLSQPVQDSLIINLLTEDNLPSYHFEIATRFGPTSMPAGRSTRWPWRGCGCGTSAPGTAMARLAADENLHMLFTRACTLTRSKASRTRP
ncbi:acyl-ACP desaturase [Streptomyces sp. NPDC085866]|uniref:acyl-ACP desaturase n=1 Tax=Streptomyces sp. NPDC085866 TaxID=3365736 RepID=UPI0037D18B6A